VLDFADDGIGFIFRAVSHQPARAFGDEAAHKDDNDAQDRTYREREAPAEDRDAAQATLHLVRTAFIESLLALE